MQWEDTVFSPYFADFGFGGSLDFCLVLCMLVPMIPIMFAGALKTQSTSWGQTSEKVLVSLFSSYTATWIFWRDWVFMSRIVIFTLDWIKRNLFQEQGNHQAESLLQSVSFPPSSMGRSTVALLQANDFHLCLVVLWEVRAKTSVTLECSSSEATPSLLEAVGMHKYVGTRITLLSAVSSRAPSCARYLHIFGVGKSLCGSGWLWYETRWILSSVKKENFERTVQFLKFWSSVSIWWYCNYFYDICSQGKNNCTTWKK